MLSTEKVERPIGEHAWDAPSRYPPRPLAVLVVIIVSISTVSVIVLWPEGDDGEGWTTQTYEEWLYDGYYNGSRFEYNRTIWGGEVVDTDDPWSVTNLDARNLTVPVMAYDALELTDRIVRLTVERFLPWLDYKGLIMTRDGPDAGRTWQVTLRADWVRVELDRRGRLEFTREMLVGPGDVIGSTGHFLANATEYLESCDALPPKGEVESLDVIRHTMDGSPDHYTYVATW